MVRDVWIGTHLEELGYQDRPCTPGQIQRSVSLVVAEIDNLGDEPPQGYDFAGWRNALAIFLRPVGRLLASAAVADDKLE